MRTEFDNEFYDILVYGGSAAGVMAAVGASRQGKKVILIATGNHLGGMTSGGLGATDYGMADSIGGLAREFYDRIAAHYGTDPNDSWFFEPHVAENILNDYVDENRVKVVYGQRLLLSHGVQKRMTRIFAVTMESGQSYRAKMFIDASYEGDLMAKAGVSYKIGREGNLEYGETLNGSQPTLAIYHQFTKKVDPYQIPGDSTSGLLQGISPEPLAHIGEGDNRIQSYCYRICTTNCKSNLRPWPKPYGYDQNNYELLLRNLEAGDLRIQWICSQLPNSKADCNNRYAISSDYIGMNYDYPDGDYAVRDRIAQEHTLYQQGLLWTLANHPRSPKPVRDYFSSWGLALDEFTDTHNWPHQLYVREARRMVSDYVITQHDCQGVQRAYDSIGLGSYMMDSHHVRRYIDSDQSVRNEGDVEVKITAPYPVSYSAIVPKAAECTNLLVPVCLSSSHIAYGSVRMEPVFMILGQSAAIAASLAIDSCLEVQKIKYNELRGKLLENEQILDYEAASTEVACEKSF